MLKKIQENRASSGFVDRFIIMDSAVLEFMGFKVESAATNVATGKISYTKEVTDKGLIIYPVPPELLASVSEEPDTDDETTAESDTEESTPKLPSFRKVNAGRSYGVALGVKSGFNYGDFTHIKIQPSGSGILLEGVKQ